MPYLGNQITTVFPSSVNLDTINNVSYVANPASGQLTGRRNIVINGGMMVSARGTNATGVGGSSGYHTIDRMNIASGTTAGRATMSQSTDVPSGFANSLKLECTTADTSVASDESFIIEYKIEGRDVQQLKKGTSSAEKVTLSFYVKGNASATYTAELLDNDNTRYNSQEFSVTTSWTRVTLTYDGDTTGTLGNDSNYSLGILFWLHAGSTFTGGTHTDNSWHTTTNQRVGDNQTSFLDSTDREFFITGIQLEVGSQATPFEHSTLNEQRLLCQRYYTNLNSMLQNNWGQAYSTTVAKIHLDFPVQMRSAPTMTYNSPFTNLVEENGVAVRTASALASNYTSSTGNIVSVTVSGQNYAVNAGVFIRNTEGEPKRIEASAEL